MPKLSEVIRVTKTQSYCQGTTCQRCVLLASQTIKSGLTEFGNRAKPLEYSEKKVVFHTNLGQMFKCTVTTLVTQPTTMQQRLTCAH